MTTEKARSPEELRVIEEESREATLPYDVKMNYVAKTEEEDRQYRDVMEKAAKELGYEVEFMQAFRARGMKEGGEEIIAPQIEEDYQQSIQEGQKGIIIRGPNPNFHDFWERVKELKQGK